MVRIPRLPSGSAHVNGGIYYVNVNSLMESLQAILIMLKLVETAFVTFK